MISAADKSTNPAAGVMETNPATIPEAIAHRAVQNPDRLESTQG